MADVSAEAGRSAAGFRLQRLRAVQLLVEAVTENPRAQVFCAIELEGDVYLKCDDEKQIHETKRSTSVKGFSFASPQVKHSVVNFARLYVENDESETLRFAFYTNTEIVKETKRGEVKNLNLQPLPRPVIELLRARDYDAAGLLDFIKTLIRRTMQLEDAKRYASTAKGKEDEPEVTNDAQGSSSSHAKSKALTRLESWGDDRWLRFLDSIVWGFGEPDQQELYDKLTGTTVPSCSRFYSSNISGKEMLVVDRLLSVMEDRQDAAPLGRLLGIDAVENAFLRVAASAAGPEDPLWKSFLDVVGQRNGEDHIRGVLEKIDELLDEAKCEEEQDLIEDWVSYAAVGQVEWAGTNHDRNMNGLRYRVLKSCQRVAKKYSRDSRMNPAEILEAMQDAAHNEIDEYKDSYGYLHSGPIATRRLIAALLDRCFVELKPEDR